LALGICYKDAATDFVCSSNAISPPSLDPLMLIQFARTLTTSAVFPPILTVSVVLSGIAFFLTLILMVPILFNWRHARNIHFLCIVSAGAAAFLLFVIALMTTSAISGVMAAIPTVSLQVIVTERGILLEAFVWTAFGIWTFTFIFVWWLRWWEILERREVKLAADKYEKHRAEERERQAKAREEMKNKPMKAEDAVLQQMAAAQV